MLVPISRVLGPAYEWEPRIALAISDHDREQRERSARRVEMAKRAGPLAERLRAAGVNVSVRATWDGVEITLPDASDAERLHALISGDAPTT